MADGSPIVEIRPEGLPYPILLGRGLLATEAAPRIRAATGNTSRAVVVTDANVGPLYATQMEGVLRNAGLEPATLTLPAGDASKSPEQAAILYTALAARKHARDEPIIALGGGVVGDLAGFVAATWHRGVPFVQCPTTLEAAIDASIGGKTAINHASGKNLIGAFHQPRLVCIDPDCLRTLDDRDFTAALAESVKHAVIRDPDFFAWHESHCPEICARDAAVVDELILRNCRNKAEVVAADERETATLGVGRAALNFGHTIGHAVESASAYALRHGEAVALGMIAAANLAVRLAGFPPEHRDRLESLLSGLRLPTRADGPLNSDDILSRIHGDKKVKAGHLRFVLPTAIGEMQWVDSPSESDIKHAIATIQPA